MLPVVYGECLVARVESCISQCTIGNVDCLLACVDLPLLFDQLNAGLQACDSQCNEDMECLWSCDIQVIERMVSYAPLGAYGCQGSWNGVIDALESAIAPIEEIEVAEVEALVTELVVDEATVTEVDMAYEQIEATTTTAYATETAYASETPMMTQVEVAESDESVAVDLPSGTENVVEYVRSTESGVPEDPFVETESGDVFSMGMSYGPMWSLLWLVQQ